MTMKRFMAIHTYHSEEDKKAMMQWAAENTASQKEFMAAQVLTNAEPLPHGLEVMTSFSVIGSRKQMKTSTTY